MFKTNTKHLQPDMFSTVNQLPEKLKGKLETSWAGTFYREVFARIDEEVFSVLYSEKDSRPNVPINLLVGLEILKAGAMRSCTNISILTYKFATRWAIEL